MKSTKMMTRIAMLGAIGFVLMLLEFPIFFFADFLRLHFADIPALLASFSMMPVAGLLVVVLENLLHLFATNSGGVGELANCIVSGTFVLVAGFLYRKYHTRRGAVLSLFLASLSMVLAAMAANFFILLPLYMPSAPIATRLSLVISAILPFNMFKAILVSLVTIFLYKPLSHLLKPKK